MISFQSYIRKMHSAPRKNHPTCRISHKLSNQFDRSEESPPHPHPSIGGGIAGSIKQVPLCATRSIASRIQTSEDRRDWQLRGSTHNTGFFVTGQKVSRGGGSAHVINCRLRSRHHVISALGETARSKTRRAKPGASSVLSRTAQW